MVIILLLLLIIVLNFYTLVELINLNINKKKVYIITIAKYEDKLIFL